MTHRSTIGVMLTCFSAWWTALVLLPGEGVSPTGPYRYIFEMPGGRAGWGVRTALTTVISLVALIGRNEAHRSVALVMHALLWTTLAVLVALADPWSPPLGFYAVLGLYVAPSCARRGP